MVCGSWESRMTVLKYTIFTLLFWLSFSQPAFAHSECGDFKTNYKISLVVNDLLETKYPELLTGDILEYHCRIKDESFWVDIVKIDLFEEKHPIGNGEFVVYQTSAAKGIEIQINKETLEIVRVMHSQ